MPTGKALSAYEKIFLVKFIWFSCQILLEKPMPIHEIIIDVRLNHASPNSNEVSLIVGMTFC